MPQTRNSVTVNLFSLHLHVCRFKLTPKIKAARLYGIEWGLQVKWWLESIKKTRARGLDTPSQQ